MKFSRGIGSALAVLALGCALPAAAQDEGAASPDEDFSVPVPETVVQPRLVTARDPSSVRDALLSAGYPATLETDDYGDPMVRTEFGGYGGKVVFYGCDAETHTECDSVQLVVGIDRRDPMPMAMVGQLMKEWRFISITLDSEGDPWFTWDIVTGDGIATSIFLDSIRGYSDTVAAAANTVFEAERDAKLDLEGDPVEKPLSLGPPATPPARLG